MEGRFQRAAKFVGVEVRVVRTVRRNRWEGKSRGTVAKAGKTGRQAGVG